MSELIKINGLSVDLMSVSGLIHAVRDINLSIGTDEIHGIVGESGCGKSMTAKSILRLHDESKVEYGGEIMFDGSDILKMKNKELLKMRAQMTQEPPADVTSSSDEGRSSGFGDISSAPSDEEA